MDDLEKYLPMLQLKQEDFDRFDLYYPKIKESVVPLALTGITPRNFFAWRNSGLIDLVLDDETDDKRRRVKFTLIEYVWVKMVQHMRDFGLSYELIKQVKNILFMDFLETMKDWGALENLFRNVLGYNDEQINGIKTIIDRAFEDREKMNSYKDANNVENSIIYMIVMTTFLFNGNFALLIVKYDNQFQIDVTAYDKMEDVYKASMTALTRPHFQIPIKTILDDFFDTPKSEKYAEIFGFLNTNELKVLEAMRKKDFTEIQIKLGKDNEFCIDVTQDTSVMDEKANAIRKILGLGQYEEVVVKYRNDKNLYVKNKKRI